MFVLSKSKIFFQHFRLISLGLFSLFLPFTTWAWSITDTNAQQLLVVTTDSWSATTGQMVRFEKTAEGFKKIGNPISVSLGKTGLGWGIGLHPEITAEPQKKEGDKRSPAGVFLLGASYGKDSQAPEGSSWNYNKISSDLVCVDDSKSGAYNKIVTLENLQGGNSTASFSHEKMLRLDHLYNRLIVVEHNTGQVKGRGSCIFLHVWRTPNSATVGCTALDQKELEQVMTWLSPEAHPVLVQLTRSEYDRLRSEWTLPSL